MTSNYSKSSHFTFLLNFVVTHHFVYITAINRILLECVVHVAKDAMGLCLFSMLHWIYFPYFIQCKIKIKKWNSISSTLTHQQHVKFHMHMDSDIIFNLFCYFFQHVFSFSFHIARKVTLNFLKLDITFLVFTLRCW